jgi:hypothetical protein
LKRRTFLSILGATSLTCWAARKTPAALLADYKVESLYLANQELTFRASQLYREWAAGRNSGQMPVAESLLLLRKSLQSQGAQLARAAGPESSAVCRRVSDVQIKGVDFLLNWVRQGPPRQADEALQKHWKVELEVEQAWLTERHRQLTRLIAASSSHPLLPYYQWRSSLHQLNLQEWKLASRLAQSFADKREDTRLVADALRLANASQSVAPPSFCRDVQLHFQQRYAALARLCQSTQAHLAVPDADSLANLQEDELNYRQLRLTCQKGTLAILKSRLGA